MPLLKREPDLFPGDLFLVRDGRLPWWVAHVRSRQEKGLARHLLERQAPFYLPLAEKHVQRHGRERVSFLPLFPGYVFFRGSAEERLAALRSQLVVRTLDVRDQDLLHAELERIWRLQQAGERLVPHPYLGPGDEVDVVDGPLKGFSGVVLREAGQTRLVVSVTLLRRSVAAVVERDAIAPGIGSGAGTIHRVAG